MFIHITQDHQQEATSFSNTLTSFSQKLTKMPLMHLGFCQKKITSQFVNFQSMLVLADLITRYDFDACDKLTTGLRYGLGPYTRVRHFHIQN